MSDTWVQDRSTGELIIDFDEIYEKLTRLGFMQGRNIEESYVFTRNFERHERDGFSIFDMVAASFPDSDIIEHLMRAYSFTLALAFMTLVSKPKQA